MADQPHADVLTVTDPRTAGLVILATGVAATVFGIVLLVAADGASVWAGVGALLLGTALEVLGVLQVVRPSSLTVDAETATATQVGRGTWSVPLPCVEAFVLVQPGPGTTLIGWRWLPGVTTPSGTAAARTLAGVDGAFPSTSGYGRKGADLEALVTELNRRVVAAGGGAERAVYDPDEVVRRMADDVDGLSVAQASVILQLWNEHLAATGILPPEAVEGRWYAPGSELPPDGELPVASDARVAADAPALIGLDEATVAAALAAEHAYVDELEATDAAAREARGSDG